MCEPADHRHGDVSAEYALAGVAIFSGSYVRDGEADGPTDGDGHLPGDVPGPCRVLTLMGPSSQFLEALTGVAET